MGNAERMDDLLIRAGCTVRFYPYGCTTRFQKRTLLKVFAETLVRFAHTWTMPITVTCVFSYLPKPLLNTLKMNFF